MQLPRLTTAAASGDGSSPEPEGPHKISKKEFEKEMEKLQVELVKLQEWVKATGAKICVIFEGRDTAGKGGVIKRITERVSPRVFRVVALGTPTRRVRNRRCTSSATCLICRPPGKWCSSTAAGTTGPASSG